MAIPETRELLLAGLYPILDDDPFALTAAERRELGSSMRAEQAAWQVLLTRAAGHPIAADFPAFLLATPAFAGIAASVRRLARQREEARDRGRMERFLDQYDNWQHDDWQYHGWRSGDWQAAGTHADETSPVNSAEAPQDR